MERKPLHVFYCDDDPDDQMLFKEIALEYGRFMLTLNNTGNELLEALRTKITLPDVIFLDLNMPRKNGIQVLKEIRQMEHCRDIPVIVFTTSANTDNIDRTHELGANLFITKPSTYNLLNKTIAHCLSIDWKTFKASRNDFVYTA